MSDNIIMMHGMKVISHIHNGNETVGSQQECEKMVYNYIARIVSYPGSSSTFLQGESLGTRLTKNRNRSQEQYGTQQGISCQLDITALEGFLSFQLLPYLV